MNARRAAALAPIPAIFAVGAVAAHAWLASAPHRIAVDLAQPYAIVTAWGAYGAGAFDILAATILAATVALLVGGRALVREPRDEDVATILAIAAIAIACAFAWPFAFSSDVYAYAAYGAMTRAGLDPYALLPAQIHGPFYEAARWQWSGTYPVCVYGPAFVALATALVATFGSLGVAATLTVFRIATALAFLGSIALVAVALGGRSTRERTIALCAYGLNPVILWSVAEGHNDAWLMLAVAGAAALARTRPRTGALVLGASLLVKAPGAAFAASAFFDRRLRLRPDRAVLTSALAAGLGAAAVLWLSLMIPALSALGSHGKYAPAVSVQGLVGPIPSLVIAALSAGYGAKLLTGGHRSGYGWLGIAALVALPNGYPWYALWLVPFALAAGPGRVSFALWIATISAVVRYLPDAVGDIDPVTARVAAALAALPLLFALTDLPVAALRKKVSAQP